MSVDFEELFDTLRRQADTIPLGGADGARLRGQRRVRVHAAVSAAVALALVAVGTGLLLRRPGGRPAPPAVAPSSAVPLVGRPIDLGGRVALARTVAGGGRAYTAWVRHADNTVWLTATELSTGAAVWTPRQLPADALALDSIVLVPAALLVVTRAGDGARLYAYDPAGGGLRWQKDVAADDELVYADSALIRFAPAAARVDAYDWATGGGRWNLGPAGDRPRRAIGMGSAADENRLASDLPEPTFQDGRVVVLTASGAAQLRDAGTGRLLHTVPAGTLDPSRAVAHDGWLYARSATDGDNGPQHIYATDLVGDVGTAMLGTVPHHLVRLGACGSARVCVVTQDGAATSIAAYDARQRRQLWHAASAVGGDVVTSAGGATMLSASDAGVFELYDATGQLLFTSTLVGGWLDSRTLLVADPDGTARVSRWSIAKRKLTPLGDQIHEVLSGCTTTSDRMVCATDDQLKVWRMNAG